MLKIENATKKFASNVVLDNVSLTISTNSIVGLAGPSGGGKSTLLRCIQGLESLDEGSIILKEESGFMFQDFQLFPHWTVMKNLTYAPSLKYVNSDHTSQAISLLQTLCIEDKVNCYPHQLSGGQKQRVALARSLMMHPKLLLCDEPTSGLDIATTAEVIALLKTVRDMGVTMVIASHDLDFLVQLTDRVVILKNGKILADVIPKNLGNPVNYLKDSYD